MQILTFVTKLLPKRLPRPMGRWRIENCHKKMNQKIDLSNEDHCGPCGQYALEKIEQKQAVLQTPPDKPFTPSSK